MADTVNIYIERETPVRAITIAPTGARGPQGEQGEQGEQGAAGPNSVTSATTSDGTATLNTSTLTTGTLTVSTSGVFNATSYTFGTGAASAFKNALAITASNISDFNSAASAAAPVQSVAGRTGNVTILSADVGDATSAATANTVARRSSLGSIVFVTCAARDFRVGSSPNFATYNGTNLSTTRAHEAPNADGTYALTTSTTGVPDQLANGTISGTVAFGTGAAANMRTALFTATGVATALNVNVGTAGAFVVNGGALGTPSSGTLTSCTGLPISTGVSGLGTNVATFLATPTSANLLAAVTDETGTGSLVFATSPTITTATLTGGTTISHSSFPPLDMVRTTAATNVPQASSRLTASSSGVVADGFGPIFSFSIVGSGVSVSELGTIGYLRAGADNTGDFVIRPATTGTQNERVRVKANGQVGIGVVAPNAAAQLQIDSTTRGFLPPRMTTTERNAITSPPAGLMIYNTTTNKLNVYTTAWEVITSA